MNGIRRFSPRQLVNDGLLGQYSISNATGVLAAGVTGDIFQFRWTDSLRIAGIRKLTMSAAALTLFGAAPANAPIFVLYKAVSWTGQGTGGIVLDPSAVSGQAISRRSLMPTSLVAAGDCRISSTAALGAGTRTISANNPLATVIGVPVSTSNTCPVLPQTELINYEQSELDYPLVLAANEGFAVQLVVNPGTGTMVVAVNVEWMETNAS